MPISHLTNLASFYTKCGFRNRQFSTQTQCIDIKKATLIRSLFFFVKGTKLTSSLRRRILRHHRKLRTILLFRQQLLEGYPNQNHKLQ